MLVNCSQECSFKTGGRNLGQIHLLSGVLKYFYFQSISLNGYLSIHFYFWFLNASTNVNISFLSCSVCKLFTWIPIFQTDFFNHRITFSETCTWGSVCFLRCGFFVAVYSVQRELEFYLLSSTLTNPKPYVLHVLWGITGDSGEKNNVKQLRLAVLMNFQRDLYRK